MSSLTPLPMKMSSTPICHQAAGLVVLRDGGAGGEDALGIAVALRAAKVVDHVHHHGLRGLQAERCGVAQVHLEDPVPLGLHGLGCLEDGPAEFVADVLKFAGVLHRTHG